MADGECGLAKNKGGMSRKASVAETRWRKGAGRGKVQGEEEQEATA